MILHGIEYQRPTSLNMRILADHVTYSFLAFMKSIFHFCLGCYCGGYSQNGRSNLSSFIPLYWAWDYLSMLGLKLKYVCKRGPRYEERNAITLLNSNLQWLSQSAVIITWHESAFCIADHLYPHEDSSDKGQVMRSFDVCCPGCSLEQAVKQRVGLSVIWVIMELLWCDCYGLLIIPMA